MFIENSVNDRYIRTLNFGCFPKNVSEFQESQDFFQQLVFVDYQLQLLIQEEYGGDELPEETSKGKEKIAELTEYIDTVSLNYNDDNKGYDEKLYYAILKAHLLFFTGQLEEMRRLLGTITVSKEMNLAKASIHQVEFIQYLTCRYFVLFGLTNYKFWIDYLVNVPESFIKSQVAAKYWLGILYFELASTLSANSPISFDDLKELKFFSNRISTISFSSYLILNTRLVDESFGTDFAAYLNEEIERHLADNQKFPDANSSNAVLDDYINNLYESIEQFQQPNNSQTIKIMKASASKKLLVNCTSKTYQSQIVLTNLVYTLIYNNEYDEAFAAFNTLVSYLEKDQEQKGGYINDILSIINIYSTCITKFNPISSEKKFKYTSKDSILDKLKTYSEHLIKYLHTFGDFVDVTYDEETEDDLSFLYRRFNPNILLPDRSDFIELVSLAWYSVGYYFYYLSTDESPSDYVLQLNVSHCLQYYKNSLVINSTGNQKFLFSYALALANNRKLKSSLKLCKFILKKYPESFKTWNLLVLLVTAFEANNSSDSKESEKFINNALNIAGLHISKNQKRLLVESKYEILQLKLTQLAVWESIHGTAYILEYIGEVFILYHELFDFEAGKAISNTRNNDGSKSIKDTKWSHRPSFIDVSKEPTTTTTTKFNAEIIETKSTGEARRLDKLRRLSRVASNTSRSLTNGTTKTENMDSANHPTTKARLVSSPPNRSVSVSQKNQGHLSERKILQEIWLWTARIYIKVGLLEDAEQCIVEAESIYEPNVRTFIALGYLTASDRKFLSLQEFERSLEILDHDRSHSFTKVDYSNTLLGLCKLFMIDDKPESSLFISVKDKNAGLIRLKNLLEKHAMSWPYGSNDSEIWYYLSKIYEIIDDKPLLTKSLWKCIELEDYRPVRSFISVDPVVDI